MEGSPAAAAVREEGDGWQGGRKAAAGEISGSLV